MGSNILLLSHKFFPDTGGIETNSEILAIVLEREGYHVRILTWSNDDSNKKFPFEVVRNPSVLRIVREHFRAHLILENNPCLKLSWPNLFLRKPSVIAINTWIRREDGRKTFVDRIKLAWIKTASKVIAVSNAVQKKCWSKAIVIENPYNDQLFRVMPDADRRLDFVFLGRLVSDKGVRLAISAIHELVNETANGTLTAYSFTIIGDGPERLRLENLVSKLGLSAFVKFAGILKEDHLVRCLNQHRYMLVPSIWEEPFGNVVLEGIACGCLPIASDGGGLPDAVGNAGLLFKSGNIHSLTKTIKFILNNPMIEAQLRYNASAHLEKHRSDEVGKKYIEVLQSALA